MAGRLQMPSIALSVFLLAVVAGGCASTATTSSPDENDPYESFNRKMFALNEKLDKNFALPVSKAYAKVLPEPARDGVHNVLMNLNSPVTLANDILQGNFAHAGATFGRLIVNTTVGLGGLIDVGTPMGMPYHEEDFGETLALYGVGEGPYLVLPLFGPSNPRDAAGRVVDVGFDPLTYIGFHNKGWWVGGRQVLGLVDERSRNIDTMDQLRRTSVDLYATLRSLYRQHRNAEIRGGKPDLQNLPNI
jgi:phospholipid-binding lipoprotein MlaA